MCYASQEQHQYLLSLQKFLAVQSSGIDFHVCNELNHQYKVTQVRLRSTKRHVCWRQTIPDCLNFRYKEKSLIVDLQKPVH